MAILTSLEIAHNKVSTLTHGNGLVCFAFFLATPFQYQNFQALSWKPRLHFSLQDDCMDAINREKVGKKKMQRRTQKEGHK